MTHDVLRSRPTLVSLQRRHECNRENETAYLLDTGPPYDGNRTWMMAGQRTDLYGPAMENSQIWRKGREMDDGV